MTLFLTSSPDGDLNRDNGGSPEGFDKRNGFADRLKAACASPAFIAFFASNPDSHDRSDEAARYFSGVFERTGIEVKGFAVCDGRNPQEAKALVDAADIIVLFGGHVPTQNAFFRSIGLAGLIKDFGGVVMGMSAGSMNCAGIVYAQPEEEGEAVSTEYKRFIPGLGLTDVNIIPHWQMISGWWLDGMKLLDEITKPDSFGHRFYLIPDGTYIMVKDGITRLYGEANLLADGKMTEVCSYGEEICID